ncbi:ABC transporter ATP-binding protein [Thalassotalea ponticola]|uniref:ABC transporter ATP-binding protein n=1 Tax=Thalassotalea ponticola TaxID=1523392 RepID=UPI0025B5B3B0|nr:ABC transporter ATP-binding protein [Thalassotalea ponticola]MDN3651884.1 ABC transporter ATP-binding protein [Thalassotalea ponticola]
MNAILNIVELRKHYGKVTAVDGINFRVEKGQCFGLLGPNGAGKTTTIELMEGLIKPDAGHVEYVNSSGRPINEIIGIQFQQTALPDLLNVRETLTLFASFYQTTLPLSTLIQLCQLEEFIDRDTRTLSGGQRQRLLLALALVNDPQIIFLDEPTTGLDPQSRRQFWQLIRHVKQQGRTVILTTHYMDEAQQLCDYIAIMDRGKIIERGAPDALLAKHFNQCFIYLPMNNVDPELVVQRGWSRVNNRVEIVTDNVEQTVSDLLQQGVVLTGLHIKSANLDDLFLKLTGHTLGESDG